MTTITPDAAQQHIDRAFVLRSLAEIHTIWGEAAWNAGDYRGAVVHWRAAAHHSITAKREGGEPQ